MQAQNLPKIAPNNSNSNTVMLGLSGGVDSSVSAHLLKEAGYNVIAVFMQNWEDDQNSEYCTIKEDSMDAIAVADKLNIDIEIINFAKEYKDQVFSYFLKTYEAGQTPNPDIFCNSEIKFKAFLNYAIKNNAHAIATGHYVGKQLIDINDPNMQTILNNYHQNNNTKENIIEVLIKAQDQNKDQSYFLYRLNQYQINHAIFPLANITKPEVRKIAASLKLPNANKKDSTGICFIGERPFRNFLQQYMHKNTGAMITPDGKVVGEHIGLMYYTIGQRKGLNIGGMGEAWFVAQKDVNSNTLIVVQGHNHPLLYSNIVYANSLSFSIAHPAAGFYTAKTRYRMQDAKCFLSYPNDNLDTIKLEFTEPQWAVTSGQSVVIYLGDICLGGGIII